MEVTDVSYPVSAILCNDPRGHGKQGRRVKFHGDVRELLIGSWKLIERAGGRPTVNAVLRAARECYGATFDNTEARKTLQPFVERSKAQQTFPEQTANAQDDTKKEQQTSSKLAANSQQTFSEQTANSQQGSSKVAASIRARVGPSPLSLSYDVARADAHDGAKAQSDEETDAALDAYYAATILRLASKTAVKAEENIPQGVSSEAPVSGDPAQNAMRMRWCRDHAAALNRAKPADSAEWEATYRALHPPPWQTNVESAHA